MAKDRFFFLLTVGGLGILAAFLFRGGDETVVETTPKEEVVKQVKQNVVNVMVAQKPLSSGDRLKAGDFVWEEIKVEDLEPSLITKDQNIEKWISDAVVAKEVPKGSKVKRLDIIWPNELEENDTYTEIPMNEGKVAYPFLLTDRAAIVKFMEPGMSVDILFTSRPDFGFGTISLTLFKEIRILSIGERSKDWVSAYKKNEPLEILLEMTPKEAEILSFAQKLGTITLGLLQEGVTPDSSHSALVEALHTSESTDDYSSILITYMLHNIFPETDVKVTTSSKGFIVSGRVRDPQIADKIREILQKLVSVVPTEKDVKNPEDNIIVDLMEVDPQQVLICVKVLEVSKNAITSLGINWKALFENDVYSTALSAVFPLPPPGDPTYIFDGVNVVAGKFTLSWVVDMLEQNGYAKILAEPNLSTISGQPAHFFVGGEFPILVPQGGDLVGTVTVEYKDFGVILDFTPTVDTHGLVTLQIAPEVSSIDKQNNVTISGFDIPSLIVRRAETTLKLWPGQCYAIAGLLQYDRLKQFDSLYGLWRLPIIGPLFRSKRFVENRTELMILITPYIIDMGRQNKPNLARCDTKYPSECPCHSHY